MGGVWSIGGRVPTVLTGLVNIPEERRRKNWPAQIVHPQCRTNCYHPREHHVTLNVEHIRKSFHGLFLGGIYTNLNSSIFLLIMYLLTAVCSGGSALGERRERLFPGNPVLLQLLVLPLVLLVCLLLVLCDQMVKIGTALAGRDVEWRSSVEDPVDILSACVLCQVILSPA
jgi:hypothetical protein